MDAPWETEAKKLIPSGIRVKLGALRKGPLFHGLRSSREIKIQDASCQMGGREVTR